MSLSRISGSLVAAVVGDCIGALFEGSSSVELGNVLGEVEKFESAWKKKKKSDNKSEGKKPLKSEVQMLTYTDDTAMARCIAASIIHHNGLDNKDLARRFSEEYARQPHRGYGGSVINVLKVLKDQNLKDIFQPARQQFHGSGSYGNGGAMRIAPLGLFCLNKDFSVLKDLTMRATQLTHTHPEAVVGAILQAHSVQLALSLDNTKPLDTDHFLNTLHESLNPIENEFFQPCEKNADEKETEGERKLPYCTKLEIIRDFLHRDVSTDEVDEKLGRDISALGSVPTAVYCFLKGSQKSVPGIGEKTPVEQAILYAISLGGDTDTIATMAGAVAGAFYGLDLIPESWQDSCEGVTDAKMFAEQIWQLVQPTA